VDEFAFRKGCTYGSELPDYRSTDETSHRPYRPPDDQRAYRGEDKTDARDALVIADQARMRRDFTPIDTPPELVSTLQLLTSYRRDLITDRVRLVNRLRDLLVGICPSRMPSSITTPTCEDALNACGPKPARFLHRPPPPTRKAHSFSLWQARSRA
jgi:hypothetical protein